MHCLLCKNKTEILGLTASHKKLHSKEVLTLTLQLQSLGVRDSVCMCLGKLWGWSHSKSIVCDLGGCLPLLSGMGKL